MLPDPDLALLYQHAARNVHCLITHVPDHHTPRDQQVRQRLYRLARRHAEDYRRLLSHQTNLKPGTLTFDGDHHQWVVNAHGRWERLDEADSA